LYHLWYCNQIWYQDVPLSHLSVYQISRELEYAFAFYNNFHTLMKRRKKREKKENPVFEGSYLGNARYDLVEIWNVRWCHWLAFPLQKLFGFIKVPWSYIYMKIALLFFLLITHVVRWLLGLHNTLPCVLIGKSSFKRKLMYIW